MNDQQLLKPEFWVKNYADILYSFALKRVNDVEVAQDLVQETFLGGLKSQKGFDGNSTEKTWLIAILKFKIIDHYRLKSKKKTTSLNQADGEEIDETNFDNNGHWLSQQSKVYGSTSIESNLERKEFYSILDSCLKKLPDKLATVFRLKMLLEEDTEVICEILNLTNSNYWVILHRAKLQLRNCMSNYK